ncbi:monofunctional biosynthetic peptidoglycan transglycosylase [Rhodovulum tesquicola]|uniref:monofunctional biosynthetic peptidoglycan transglycosylase n=1 Tax=Rhodovulum tesquicola TaxID=540254 RepID=UPI002097FE9B|nr:monofunctional biosynthetic peptidoglycan transglycosylase [Rhodovulum tesquicola]MCO8143668.1 monofunctional biosynthetic peptidoglycan transglycosylase [Rhodovulum tesquicola]
MAKRKAPARRKAARKGGGGRFRLPALPRPRITLRRLVWGMVLLAVLGVVAPKVVNPPLTHTMWSEGRRLGGIEHRWVAIEDVAPAMRRAVVAAEDANFCRHWGFDMRAIRGALEAGGRYGASTISQQTVKNVYLWQSRSWPRKALEAVITPLVELTWSKRRILEVYLNVAEFGEGVFGVDAAARHYFGVPPDRLSAAQAAALAVVLPAPKTRNAARLTPQLQRRAARISDGAATIRADGRSACFES